MAVTWCCGSQGCKTHCHGCTDVAWTSFRQKDAVRNLVLFRVKWLQPAMKDTSSVRAGVGVVRTAMAVSMCFASSCALQLHGVLEASCVIFLVKVSTKKASKPCFFLALASRSGFGTVISRAVVCSCIVFCNAVSAKSTVMAASRFLEHHRRSYWNGCLKVAIAICRQNLSILARAIFLWKVC